MTHVVPYLGSELTDGRWILSAGIDIGTSTTKLIISRLKLARTSSALSLPRYEIVRRELVYESPIYGTPLKGSDEIDAEQIWDIVSRDYEKAGLRPSELNSGAVIITGETANKRNAQQIVHLLAERSGEFVVATAGADLEGLLAGKGAGADDRSLSIKGAVANIDVGGGTANAAVFLRGKSIGTVTFHVGGRLIQLDSHGTIQAVSPSIRSWLSEGGYRLEPGRQVSFELLKDICSAMSRHMLDYLAGYSDPMRDRMIRSLMMGEPLESVPAIEEWMVSGGIGRMMGDIKPGNLAETAVHGDIGPLLAHTLKEQAANYPIRLVKPDQTVRATVIGAGMQSIEVSGATVHLDETVLPIRNLPVLKLELSGDVMKHSDLLEKAVTRMIRDGSVLFDRDAAPPFALAISGLSACTYASLQRLADLLAAGFKAYVPESNVLAVVCESDIAKALGQSLSKRCGQRTKVVCIDQVKVEHGDYIDLGEPIAGKIIPVVVKTLAFSNKRG